MLQATTIVKQYKRIIYHDIFNNQNVEFKENTFAADTSLVQMVLNSTELISGFLKITWMIKYADHWNTNNNFSVPHLSHAF